MKRNGMSWLAAVCLGLMTFVAMMVCAVPGLDPSLWEDMAAVAMLRPPQTVFPGYWRMIVGLLVDRVGLDVTLQLLPPLGWMTAALSVMLFYRIVRRLLRQLVRTSKPYAVWDLRIAPFFSAASTLVFAAGDPLWRISQTLSPDGIHLFLFLLIVHQTVKWLAREGRGCAYRASILIGLLAADTPFAFALPFAFWGLHMTVWSKLDAENVMDSKEYAYAILPKWRLFFFSVIALALGTALNIGLFEFLGGNAAAQWALGTSLIHYAVRYWHVLEGAATGIGWILCLCFGFLPLVLSLRLTPRTLQDERWMPFGTGLLLFFVTVLAVMESGAFPFARFWTFSIGGDVELVGNGFLLAFFGSCATVALALCGAAFTFECQRKYLDSAWNDVLDAAGADTAMQRDLVRIAGERMEMRPASVALKVTVPVLTAALVASALWQCRHDVESEMQRIVYAAIAEIVEECGDAKWLFADGRFDAAIELEALRRGRTLRTLDMMSGGYPWAVAVRQRGFDADSQDARAAETGVPVLFRIWAGEKPNGLDTSALMLGFEYWKRAKKPLPTLSGLIGRTKGLSPEDAEAGIRRTRALAERILALAPRIASADPTRALQDAYTATAWRLSRFASLRNERELADNLIESSSFMKHLFGAIEEERQRILMLMTPMEGLQMALARTNFAEARRYALVILGYDEDNLMANFAVGMSAISMNRLKEAELYLSKCYKLQPREAAVVNNLSIVCRKLGRYDEALKYAKLAVELLPDSSEARQTLEDAEKRKP